MTGAEVLAVAAGGAAGAALRWVLGEWAARHGSRPTGTLVANGAGAVLLALVVARIAPGTAWHLALGAGAAGALSTVSSYAVEVVEGERLPGGRWGYALGTPLLCALLGVAVLAVAH